MNLETLLKFFIITFNHLFKMIGIDKYIKIGKDLNKQKKCYYPTKKYRKKILDNCKYVHISKVVSYANFIDRLKSTTIMEKLYKSISGKISTDSKNFYFKFDTGNDSVYFFKNSDTSIYYIKRSEQYKVYTPGKDNKDETSNIKDITKQKYDDEINNMSKEWAANYIDETEKSKKELYFNRIFMVQFYNSIIQNFQPNTNLFEIISQLLKKNGVDDINSRITDVYGMAGIDIGNGDNEIDNLLFGMNLDLFKSTIYEALGNVSIGTEDLIKTITDLAEDNNNMPIGDKRKQISEAATVTAGVTVATAVGSAAATTVVVAVAVVVVVAVIITVAGDTYTTGPGGDDPSAGDGSEISGTWDFYGERTKEIIIGAWEKLKGDNNPDKTDKNKDQFEGFNYRDGKLDPLNAAFKAFLDNMETGTEKKWRTEIRIDPNLVPNPENEEEESDENYDEKFYYEKDIPPNETNGLVPAPWVDEMDKEEVEIFIESQQILISTWWARFGVFKVGKFVDDARDVSNTSGDPDE